MLNNTRLGHWRLLHRCYLDVLGLSFSTHSRILFSSEYFHYKNSPLAARYNLCQGLVPGRCPAVGKHWSKLLFKPPTSIWYFSLLLFNIQSSHKLIYCQTILYIVSKADTLHRDYAACCILYYVFCTNSRKVTNSRLRWSVTFVRFWGYSTLYRVIKKSLRTGLLQ
jgi:hypothetical protein